MHLFQRTQILLVLMAESGILHRVAMAQDEKKPLHGASMQDDQSFPFYVSQEIWDMLGNRKVETCMDLSVQTL